MHTCISLFSSNRKKSLFLAFYFCVAMYIYHILLNAWLVLNLSFKFQVIWYIAWKPCDTTIDPSSCSCCFCCMGSCATCSSGQDYISQCIYFFYSPLHPIASFNWLSHTYRFFYFYFFCRELMVAGREVVHITFWPLIFNHCCYGLG